MRKLQKQILSITSSNFEIPEQFENDEEIYSNVNAYLGVLRNNNIKERLHALGTNVEEFDLSKIYIPSKNFTNLSNYLCKDWEEIEFCLSKYFEQTIKNKSGKEEKIKKMIKTVSSLSLLEIEEMLDKFSLKEDRRNVKEYLSTIIGISENMTLNSLSYDPEIILIESDNKIQEIKIRLDSIMSVIHWQKNFIINEEKEKDVNFYTELNSVCDEILDIIPLYNRVRNYVTRKLYSVEKMKLNFGSPTLADGWSKSKEYSNNAILLIKAEKYYLGILNPKNKPEKHILEGRVEKKSEEDYKKVVYNLLPGPNKMLPKVFISSKTGIENYHPSEYILDGYNTKRHIKSSNTFDIQYCRALIDYFKQCIQIHPEWKNYNFKFSDTDSYQDISEFYKEVAEQGYKIDFCYLSKDDIDNLIDSGQMYLFQIYNKDFAPGKKGQDNLHTMYLKNLFSEDNLKDVVLKLNGQAELFYRKSSIKCPVVHKEGSILLNKTYLEKDATGSVIKKTIPDNLYQELYMFFNGKTDKLSAEADKIKDKCNYYPATMDIIKDKRFTVDQYSFHCPITINFKAQNRENVNQIALRHIARCNNINVIGIDRGERNLIYVSVINNKGEILEQKSFNMVNDYNYKEKLDQKERGRQDARKNWKEIGKIKELKEGYLSQVIHELVQMMIEYHAIVVMEDLNRGFKRGRFKVEKQVYQKFETMLIDKLNYLVDKRKPVYEEGGLLKGFQLSYVPENLSKLGRQCGMIFYVPASYTSKIDPTTGFVDVFRHKELTSGVRKKDFLIKFDEIFYDSDRDMFAFSFDYDNFATYQTKLAQKKWKVYTNGERIVKYRKDGYWIDEVVYPTQMIKKALDEKEIDYKDGHNLLDEIKNLDARRDLDTISLIQNAFRNTVTMRNSLTNNESYDRIISPVINASGKFFDSLKYDSRLPVDADANGAYHIALKGLYLTNQIQKHWDGKEIMSKDVLKIDHEIWFDYVQNQKYKE